MQQFVLVGPQGNFPVPPGESLMGSDAACHICIQGEGVLPVHAYLRMEGEKLLIRPADVGTSSAGYSGAVIAVNGAPLNGPGSVTRGQEFTVGNIPMRLVGGRAASPGLWSRRWVRVASYTFGGLLGLLLLAYFILAYVILDETRLKEKVAKFVDTHFQRDQTEIKSIDVRIFDNTFTITDLKIPERDAFASSYTSFVTIPKAKIKLDLWRLLFSELRDVQDLQIELENPELNIERAKADGSLNIDDILEKFRKVKEPLNLNLSGFEFDLAVKNGVIRIRDNFMNAGAGESTLEEARINAEIALDSEGKPIVIKSCTAKVTTSTGSAAAGESGTLTVTRGSFGVIDQYCMIDAERISADVEVELKDFDLARLFEHFGYSWRPYNANFKVVLGKPITGHFSLFSDDPKRESNQARAVRVEGKVESESLLSILEKDKAPLGDLPMRLDFKTTLVPLEGFNRYIPQNLDLRLLSGQNLGNDSRKYFDFSAKGQTIRGMTSYKVKFNCVLHDLLSTDVGKRMGLEKRLEGRLEGSADLLQQADGSLKIDAQLDTREGYVNVPAPNGRGTIKQHLPLNFDFHATADPSDNGRIPQIIVKSFSLSAPSFEAKSEVQCRINEDKNGNLSAQAKFGLNLKGREFWTEFAPILNLFGFTQPIEEEFKLIVTIQGENGKLVVGAEGTAARQWGPNPAPVKLITLLDYNFDAAKVKRADSPPYLKLVLQTTSKEKPEVRVEAHSSRLPEMDVLEFTKLDKDGKDTHLPGLQIRSDVVMLRERFEPYIEAYLRKVDDTSRAETSLLKLFRDTTVTGELQLDARMRMQRMTGIAPAQPDRVDFEIDTAGALEVNTPYRIRTGPKVVESRWAWAEPAMKMTVKGNYLQRLMNNREEPDVERLTIDGLTMKGRLGSIQASASNVDLFLLSKMGRLPNKTWTDAIGALSFSGQLDSPIYDLLKSIQVLPANETLGGTLAVEFGFDRKADLLDIKKCVFTHTGSFFLTGLNLTGTLLNMRELCQRLAPANDNGTVLWDRISMWMDEGGPAQLLAHLGKEVTLHSADVDTAPFVKWLQKTYSSKPGNRPPEFLRPVFAGEVRPEGTWRARGVRLTRPDLRYTVWQMVAASLRTDLTIPGPTSAAYAITHDYSAQLGIAVGQNNNITLSGDVILDGAYLFAAIPALKYEYKKQPATPCKIVLSGDCFYSHRKDIPSRIEKLQVLGSPVALDLSNFEMDLVLGRIKVGELAIAGGPLPCKLAIPQYSPDTDKLDMTLSAAEADLAYLASITNAPDYIKIQGQLKNAAVKYRGSLLALRATIDTQRAGLAERLKLEASDPRLRGINPDLDTLEFDAALAGVRVQCTRPEANATLAIDGHCHLGTRDIGVKDLKAQIEIQDAGKPAVKHAFSAPNLQVNSTDAKLNLVQALGAAGLPVEITANVDFSTPLDGNQIAIWARLPGAQTFVGGNVKVPAIQLGSRRLEQVVAENVILKGMKVTVPLLTATVLGGKLALNDCEFDFAKMPAVGASAAGFGFEQRIKLVGADPLQILGLAGAPASGFGFTGQVDAQGNLKGVGVDGIDRLTWDGAVKLIVGNAALALPAPEKQAVTAGPIAPWMKRYAQWGGARHASAARMLAGDTVALQELGKDLGETPTVRLQNGWIVALDVYLARTFGVEMGGYEFKPVTPTVVITKGIAAVEPFQLIGQGKCEGLDLQVKNLRINLTDETFSDEGALIYPIAIPQSAKDRLRLERWPPAVSADFLRAMAQGTLPLQVNGPLTAPLAKFPWGELQRYGRKALFGEERIPDMETLVRAREHLLSVWGGKSDELDAAADVGDRAGIGLPGTVSSRAKKESIVDSITALPPDLARLLDEQTPALDPRLALPILMFPGPAQIVPLPPIPTPLPPPGNPAGNANPPIAPPPPVVKPVEGPLPKPNDPGKPVTRSIVVPD